jgi:hypothetical protein
MTAQTITATDTKNLTNLEKLWIWLKAADDGFDYDPQEQLYESHKRLSQQVERLLVRVHNLETLPSARNLVRYKG